MDHTTSTAHRVLTVLGGLTIAYVWLMIIGDALFFPDAEDEIALVDKLAWGAIPMAATVAMGAGLGMRQRSPRAAYRLIVAGAIGPLIWFWMIFLYGPLMIATIVVATNATPRKSPRIAST